MSEREHDRRCAMFSNPRSLQLPTDCDCDARVTDQAPQEIADLAAQSDADLWRLLRRRLGPADSIRALTLHRDNVAARVAAVEQERDEAVGRILYAFAMKDREVQRPGSFDNLTDQQQRGWISRARELRAALVPPVSVTGR